MTTYSGRDFWEAAGSRWPVAPLKRIAKLGTGHTPSRSHPEYWENCTIPWVTTEDLTRRTDSGLAALMETRQLISEVGLANSAAVLHPTDTVMLSRTASVGHVVRIGRPMATTQAFVTWSCGDSLDPRYLVLMLKAMAPEFRRIAYGSTHLTIYMPDIEQLRVPVPPIQVQRAIAQYLDAETARIDALIAQKAAMLELLEERWRAQLRWLAHSSDWPWVPLRRLWTVTDCKHVTPEYSESGAPVVSPGDVTPGRLDLGRCHRFVGDATFADLTAGGRRPVRGDVVYSRNASIGIASYVDTDERFTMGQDVCLIRSSTQDQLWLTFMLNSVGIDQLKEMKIGSTFDRVNIAQLLNLRVPAPDPAVQQAEAARLDAGQARVDRLRERITSQVSLLQEHRQALITAAVTGELEIPGVA